MGGSPRKPSDIYAFGMTIFEVRALLGSAFHGILFHVRSTPMIFLWVILIQENLPSSFHVRIYGLNAHMKMKHHS
jgi:hypothetical protein